MTTTAAIDPRRAELAVLKAAQAKHKDEYSQHQRTVAAATKRRRDIEETYLISARTAEREMAAARQQMMALDSLVGSAELALRRSADPRLSVLIRLLPDAWDRERVHNHDHEAVLALRDRVRAAVARLEVLQLDLDADVDREIVQILEVVKIPRQELVFLGWR